MITSDWGPNSHYDEAARLRARVSELETETVKLRTALERQLDELGASKALVDGSLDGITLTSMTSKVLYANEAFRMMSGFGDSAVGRLLEEFYTPESFSVLRGEVLQTLTRQGAWRGVLRIRRPDGGEWMGQTSAFLLKGSKGEPTGMAAFFRDITAQLLAEQERLAHVQLIEEQQVALRQLGTPLIPIADGIVAMPLIGTIDSVRAQQILETLLDQLAERHAKVAILDITGVKLVDTQVASALMQTAQAAKLLGAEVVLTGIRPAVAQSLVQLGAELRGIVTCGNFQTGIAYALKRSER